MTMTKHDHDAELSHTTRGRMSFRVSPDLENEVRNDKPWPDWSSVEHMPLGRPLKPRKP
jgi:hypothetical protein